MTTTIFAPSTPTGGAIALARISGPETRAALKALFSRADAAIASPRVLTHGALSFCGRALDDCMAVYFSAPRSYTGEDMAELQIHGSPAIMRALLSALSQLGLLLAQPGEFTKRAFLNGKMDLSSAESVMLLIGASSEAAAALALEQMRGALSRKLFELENTLLDASAMLGAVLDYPEETDESELAPLSEALNSAKAAIQELLSTASQGALIRDGLRVGIVGRPNAGKSTLLNALMGQERAIVAEAPGTTRDTLEESVQIAGVRVRLTDMAGLRETDDPIERIGVSRALEAIEHQDVLLVLLDASEERTQKDDFILSLANPRPHIIVHTKCDLAPHRAFGEGIAISAKTGDGLAALREAIAAFLPSSRPDILIASTRQFDALKAADRHVAAAQEALQNAIPPECAAVELQSALLNVGELTGTAVNDAVIDRIFESFCLGK